MADKLLAMINDPENSKEPEPEPEVKQAEQPEEANDEIEMEIEEKPDTNDLFLKDETA